MRARKPIPTRWLMTDERMADLLWPALRQLPPGSGIVFRHYATPPAERRRLLVRIRRVARARKLIVVVAGASTIRADGVHGKTPTMGLRTWPAHSRMEALHGLRAGADALFVSPICPSRSHPGVPGIGAPRALRIGRGLPIIALGGMTERRWRRMPGFHGWAAIDAWMPRR